MKSLKFLMLFVVLIPLVAFSGELAPFSPYKGFSSEDEIVIARNENTKLFRQSNGRFVWRVFLHPVHFIDKNGIFWDICFDGENRILETAGQDYAGYADLLSWPEQIVGGTIWINEPYYYGFSRFNTEAIPDLTVIETVKLSLHCETNATMSGTHDLYSMESKPTPSSNPYSVANDVETGELYVDDFFPWENTDYTWILGDELSSYACQQMMSLLPEDWFAVGLSDWSNSWLLGSITYSGAGGYIEVEQPTAVALVSFTASPDMDYVQLKWQTEFEVDNLQWIIERKGEHGDYYEVIGTLPGQFTKPTPTNYVYTDRDVLPGEKYYYRLIDVSTHGYQSTHNPLSVQIPACIGEQLLVSPTIFNNKLTMHIRGVYGKSGMLSIFDNTGRLVKEITISGSASPIAIEWNGTDSNGRRLSNGVYFIRLAINGNKSETKKVVLIK